MAEEVKKPKKKTSCGEFGCLILIVMVVMSILLPQLGGSHSAARRASCQNNLKQMGLVLIMYASEHDDLFPTQQVYGCDGEIIAWSKALNASVLIPEYLTDHRILECPDLDGSIVTDWKIGPWDSELFPNPTFKVSSMTGNGVVDACELMELSYTYYGYAFEQLERLPEHDNLALERFRDELGALRVAVSGGDVERLQQNWPILDMDLIYSSVEGESEQSEVLGSIFRPVQSGWHGEQITLASVGNSRVDPSRYIVMHERIPADKSIIHPASGDKFGINVLFMDGHVEFILESEENLFPFGPVGGILQQRW